MEGVDFVQVIFARDEVEAVGRHQGEHDRDFGPRRIVAVNDREHSRDLKQNSCATSS